jgi:hypothetical protein
MWGDVAGAGRARGGSTTPRGGGVHRRWRGDMSRRTVIGRVGEGRDCLGRVRWGKGRRYDPVGKRPTGPLRRQAGGAPVA